MQNKIIKYPNGVTLDLSNVENELCKLSVDFSFFISENKNLPINELIQKTYDEFFNDVNKELKEWRKLR